MGMVTAVEMARSRGVDPKRFRAALRSDPQIDWHEDTILGVLSMAAGGMPTWSAS